MRKLDDGVIKKRESNFNTHRNYEMVENYAVQLIQEAIQLAAMCKKARAV